MRNYELRIVEKKPAIFFRCFKPAFTVAFVVLFYTVAGKKTKLPKLVAVPSMKSMAHLYKTKRLNLFFTNLNPGKRMQALTPGATCDADKPGHDHFLEAIDF